MMPPDPQIAGTGVDSLQAVTSKVTETIDTIRTIRNLRIILVTSYKRSLIISMYSNRFCTGVVSIARAMPSATPGVV